MEEYQHRIAAKAGDLVSLLKIPYPQEYAFSARRLVDPFTKLTLPL